MKTRTLWLTSAALLQCLILMLMIHSIDLVTPAADARPQRLRVLFIGNSYTIYNDLPWITRQLSLSSCEARALEVDAVAMMGATLEEHWQDGFALRKLRQEGPWDYVVLQGQSMMPVTEPEKLARYVRLFDEEVKQAGGRTVLLVTWAHLDHPQDQAVIDDVYYKVARELGAAVAPVGDAWRSAQAADPSLTLNIPDADSHPNAAGSYLAACTLYSVIYGRSPQGLTRVMTDRGMLRHQFDPPDARVKAEPFSLDESRAVLLQQAAWETVQRVAPQLSAHRTGWLQRF